MSTQQLVAHLEAAGNVLLPHDGAPWLDVVEARSGCALPKSYRALLEQYVFDPIVVNGLELFSNHGDGSVGDITRAPFMDRAISRWMHAQGYFQFARPATGSYDPVCFACRARREEPPVVRIDHEHILNGRSVVGIHPLAGSFVQALGIDA